jgi:hypothetical protein
LAPCYGSIFEILSLEDQYVEFLLKKSLKRKNYTTTRILFPALSARDDCRNELADGGGGREALMWDDGAMHRTGVMVLCNTTHKRLSVF